MTTATIAVAPSTETGSLGLMHLKRYWAKMMARHNGAIQKNEYTDEWSLDKTLLAAAGIGLAQAIGFLHHNTPTFEEFEQWVLAINNGSMDAEKIKNFNRIFAEGGFEVEAGVVADVLSAADIAFWEENGYVIVRNAISREDCEASVKLVCDSIDVDLLNPATWYNVHPRQEGIMVQLFQHPQLEKNRQSARMRGAFEQLWGRVDIWPVTDRTGFNPPETPAYTYQGAGLHWDVSLRQPILFGTQGILYLTDTAENQGAFTLVPGFQHRVGAWLQSLPHGASPRNQDLYALGAQHIAANAGDLIIWHHALPHGASPNTSVLPRIVQYVNYKPAVVDENTVWI